MLILTAVKKIETPNSVQVEFSVSSDNRSENATGNIFVSYNPIETPNDIGVSKTYNLSLQEVAVKVVETSSIETPIEVPIV